MRMKIQNDRLDRAGEDERTGANAADPLPGLAHWTSPQRLSAMNMGHEDAHGVGGGLSTACRQ